MSYRDKNLSFQELRKLWIEHVEKEQWFTDTQSLDTEKRIINLFGNPPYRFLKIGDPVPEYLLTRKRRTILDPKYRNKYSIPNYNALGKNPHFIDTVTKTQFWRASGDLVDELIENGDMKRKPDPIVINTDRPNTYAGDQIMFVRLPRNRNKETYRTPSPENDIILTYKKSSIICKARIHSIFIPDKRSTGWAILSNFTCNILTL